MLSEAKKRETLKQINELLATAKIDLATMIDSASASGALTEEMKKEDGNYLLAKALITIYFDKRPYAPLSPISKEEVENLSHFF